MKMPDTISTNMFAPCGVNCAVCYKHVKRPKRGTPCPGCLGSDTDKPKHCRTCAKRFSSSSPKFLMKIHEKGLSSDFLQTTGLFYSRLLVCRFLWRILANI